MNTLSPLSSSPSSPSSQLIEFLCKKSVDGQLQECLTIQADLSCDLPATETVQLDTSEYSAAAALSYEAQAFALIAKLYPHISPDILALSLKPQRQIIVEVPLQRDDGSIVSYTGYRVQYNNRRGPFKGGLRFHPEVDLSEAITLSRLMAQKTALVNIPFGGGKGGIAVDPKLLSARELEQLTRNFLNLLAAEIGPDKDIPAPDVNTTPKIMGWIFDEYSKRHGEQPAVVTGKPVELFGSLGRNEATGRGVMYTTRAAALEIGLELKGAKVIVQGFGNVGYHAAKLLVEECGAVIVGLSTSSGAIYSDSACGIDVEKAQAFYKSTRSLNGFEGSTAMTNEQLLCAPCDVLIPAALGRAITVAVAAQVQAKLIVEGANDCTLPEADVILQSRGITVVPDILANSGGVIVSYFEWVQNRTEQYWGLDEVRASLEKMITAAYTTVSALSSHAKISQRLSAYVIAHKRIAEATSARGIS